MRRYADSEVKVIVVSSILLLIGLALFIFVPVSRYMKVDRLMWVWTVNVNTYMKICETRTSYKYDTSNEAMRDFDNLKQRLVPEDAYDIMWTLVTDVSTSPDGTDSNGNPKTKTVTKYYHEFKYAVNRWQKNR